MEILIVGILVLLVLAAVMIVAVGRRRATSDPEGNVTGKLSGETTRKDTPPAKDTEPEGDATGTETGDAHARAEDTRKAIGSGGAPPAKKEGAELAERQPVDPEALGVSRRQFFNRGILGLLAISAGTFGAAALAFLYAKSAGGFGGKVSAGADLSDILAYNNDNKAPFYVPEARSYLVPYPQDDVKNAEKIPQYKLVIPGMEKGIVALYQKCVHLGCKVPWCQTSQWFECPCHGSKYNRVGEKRGGPAPRGLDHFVMSISGQSVTIDTSTVVTGPPIGTDTTGQGAEGPACVGG